MTEAIAIVGMACRFPGASSLEAYWKLLQTGTEAVREPPRGRVELEPPPWLVEQAPACRRGGFFEDLDQFEPGFFRISPREAARMDPQQRLLLEVAWEALEDAGQPVAALSGTATGVFVGVMNADFARRHSRDLTQIDAQLGPGSSLGIAPNRISFVLDLRGPSMAIDTLCSSSLVAVHQACQSLLVDESSPIAIAGGVNVILDRTMDVFYGRAGLLSKEGRCRAFDAGACGIVRGEGVGLVVLKRLSRALADGDRIHAVIRSSAVNQDGRSNGLTSPSRWSQEDVLRTAYRRAGVLPSTVPYVEAHGTGTLIGDPIETAALGAVMGEGRVGSCAIGSVKTNLGHLESAAGVASLIKAVLSLEQRTIVPSLHFARANPYVRLDERRLHVPTSAQPWVGELLAGVSSFGMGGTNAHVVLAGVDGPSSPQPSVRRASLIPISARSVAALDELETRTIQQLASYRSIDVAHSAGVRRDHHDHRRVIVALSGPAGAELVPPGGGSVVPGRTHRLVFVCPDDGSFDRETAAALVAEEPVVREALARGLADGVAPISAFQHALVAWWSSVGLIPDAVVHATRDTVSTLTRCLGEDSTIFVELGSRPMLVEPLREVLAKAGAIGAVLSSAVPGLGLRAALLHTVGALYCLGVAVDWRLLDAPEARFVRLGTYPWQKESCRSQPASTEILVSSWERASALVADRTTGDWCVVGDAPAIVAGLQRLGATMTSFERARNIVALCGPELGPTVRLVQSLASRGEAAPRLWLVTHGACVLDATVSSLANATRSVGQVARDEAAQPRFDGTALSALASATVWGFGRVVMNEHPRLHCTLIDLAADSTGDETELVLRELVAGDGEREIAIRAGTRYVARLGRGTLAGAGLRLREDAAYLVTGGLGGLGFAAARRLVERGSKTVVLLSRRGVADETQRAVAALTATGATVIVERADVADREALAGVLSRHRVRGVIHAAGVMTPAMISAIDPGELQAMLAAKVDGARNLHELTAELDFFVLYSSIATLLGMPGQGAYAAANAYLDALAGYRRARGLPAASIAWTVIEGTGMAAHAGSKALGQLRDRGVATLSVDRATDLLEQVLSGSPPHVGAVTFDLRRWAAFYPHASAIARLSPLDHAPGSPVSLDDADPIDRSPASQSATAASLAPNGALGAATPGRAAPTRTSGLLAAELRPRTQAERLAMLEAFLCASLATVLHDGSPDPTRPLSDLGMDSLTAIELQEIVKTELEFDLSADRLLGKTSIRELAIELASRFGGEVQPNPPPSSLRDDARLDASITFTRRETTTRSILLTGATGFLGAFVLAELLEHSRAKVHCLVRAGSEREAMQRLEATLARYDLPALDLAARVTCVPGDLTKPRLGIAGDLDRLAIDTIVHSGASVNFVFPYEALAADNVGGTREILRLAAATGARLHHVSTIGVFPGGHRDTVLETSRSTEPERLALGYMRAKWVAEELVAQAAGRGLDVTVYRPGTISGHARTGAFNPDDFVCALMKGCVQLGLAPSVDAPINLAPVDYVARALVRIALGRSSGTYHLVGRQPVAWNEIVEWIERLGYPIESLPYPEWRAILVERAVATGNALAPLLPLFVEHETTDWLQLPAYDDARTESALCEPTIACPRVDASLIKRYVERFVVSGYLPRPPRR